MSRLKTVFLTLICFAFFFSNSFSQNCAEFNSASAGTVFSVSNGNPNGSVIISEAGIDFRIEYLAVNDGTRPLQPDVVVWDPSIYNDPNLQNGNYLWFGDALLDLDFSNLNFQNKTITMVVSDDLLFLDINGGGAITGPISTQPTNIAPGVTMQWTAGSNSGGTLELSGVITSLKFGSWELGVDDICVEENLATSISPQELATFEVYPNPTTEFLRVNSSSPILNAQVLDLQGAVQAVTVRAGMVDVADLARGLYLLQVETEAGIVTQKFIKQ